ncbi:hypothetical protein VDIAB_100638 [Vibrio diabolicus]|nr:hypothetical protein VDIAB_100638 [Vibrio diabolicus]
MLLITDKSGFNIKRAALTRRPFLLGVIDFYRDLLNRNSTTLGSKRGLVTDL